MSYNARILIIDDDPLFRSLLVTLLRKGNLVSVAAEGQEGFHKATAHPPDVAIIDINMPGWDGLTTLAEFRSHPILKNTKIIMLTGDASRETVVAAISAGANDYVIKTGFSKEEFCEKVEGLARMATSVGTGSLYGSATSQAITQPQRVVPKPVHTPQPAARQPIQTPVPLVPPAPAATAPAPAAPVATPVSSPGANDVLIDDSFDMDDWDLDELDGIMGLQPNATAATPATPAPTTPTPAVPVAAPVATPVSARAPQVEQPVASTPVADEEPAVKAETVDAQVDPEAFIQNFIDDWE